MYDVAMCLCAMCALKQLGDSHFQISALQTHTAAIRKTGNQPGGWAKASSECTDSLRTTEQPGRRNLTEYIFPEKGRHRHPERDIYIERNRHRGETIVHVAFSLLLDGEPLRR